MDAELVDLLKIGAGVAGGGAGIAFLNYLTASRSSNREDFLAVLEARRLEAVEQAATIADLRTRFEDAIKAIDVLNRKVAAMLIRLTPTATSPIRQG